MIPYTVIKYQIDLWDPLCLLSMHAPSDEYCGEVKIIFNEINNLIKNQEKINSISLAKIIYETFQKSFGNDLFKYDKSDCKRIADKILNM